MRKKIKKLYDRYQVYKKLYLLQMAYRSHQKIINQFIIAGVILILANIWHATVNLQAQSSIDIGQLLTTNFHTSQQLQQQPSYPFAFSACLLIKDSNIILPEWLAYHYTVLPLRRLIVAIDPHSHTNPSPLLDKYNQIGLNITIMNNDKDYWIDGSAPHEKLNFVITNSTSMSTIKKRHDHRQRVFYRTCFNKLHKEGMTWTIAVDIDEYIAFNHYDENEGKPSSCYGNETCDEMYLKSIRDGTNKRTKFNNISTAAEYINSHADGLFDVPDTPCIVIGRFLFVSKEIANNNNIGRRKELDNIPNEFNISNFHTLRYQYRASLNSPQQGKSIVDVSRYDGRFIPNPHRLLGDNCTGGGSWSHNSAMSFRVHHYVGSWLSFRQPGYDIRGYQTFKDRNNQKDLVFDNTTGVSGGSTWLARFVKMVGTETALILTQDFRMKSELERMLLVVEAHNDASR